MKRLALAISLFAALICFGNSITVPQQTPFFSEKQTPVSGGGGGTWTLLTHTFVKATGTVSTLTSPTFSTSGANLVVFIVTWSGGSATVGSTSAGDTVASSTTYTAANPKIQCFYVISPTSSASYSVTAAQGGNAIDSIEVYVLNKSGGVPAFDTEAAGFRTANWQATTINGGSTTPAATDAYFTGVAWDVLTTTTATVDSGFTLSPDGNMLNNYGANSAYKLNVTTATNPGWTGSPTANADADTSTWCFK